MGLEVCVALEQVDVIRVEDDEVAGSRQLVPYSAEIRLMIANVTKAQAVEHPSGPGGISFPPVEAEVKEWIPGGARNFERKVKIQCAMDATLHVAPKIFRVSQRHFGAKDSQGCERYLRMDADTIKNANRKKFSEVTT